MATPAITDFTWGFFEDDSTNPDTCTQIGTTDSTSESAPLGSIIHVRIGSQNDASANFADTVQLQYRLGTGGTWTNVDAGVTTPVRATTTALPTDGAACATQLLTSGAGSFDSDGQYDDDNGLTASAAHPKNTFYENQWGVLLQSAYITAGTVIFFRTVHTGANMTYGSDPTGLPQITATTAGISGSGSPTIPTFTSSAAGDVDVSGSGTDTVAVLTSTSSGDVAVTGTGSGTIATVAASSSGDVEVAGTGSDTVATVTASGAGTVSAGGITGTGSAVIAVVTASSAGAVEVAGTGDNVVTTVTSSGAGTVGVAGTGDNAVAILSSSAAGTVAVTGTMSKAVASVTASGTGSVSSGSMTLEGFRFRNDDGNETGATWAEAQDTNLTIARGQQRRLRLIVDNVEAGQYQLEVAVNGTEDWHKVGILSA